MRTALMVAVMLALAVAGGCGIEQERIAKEKEFSAARLSGKYSDSDPIVQMLSPEEREALRQAGLMREELPGDELATADGAEGGDAKGDEDTTLGKQARGTMMSVLTVGVTLGMMAAPFLLF